MVKVREDQPLDASGKVDIQQWLTRLQEDVRLREPERLVDACKLAETLELEAPRTHRVWLSPGSSFRMGLEMADILGELKLDQATLEAAVLYRAVREGLLSLDAVTPPASAAAVKRPAKYDKMSQSPLASCELTAQAQGQFL